MVKQRFNRVPLYLVLGLLSLPAIAPVYSQSSQDSLVQHLQTIMDTKMTGYGLKGAALTIVLPDEKTYTLTSGYANGTGDPVDTVRKWHWASCTKALTGFVALQLIEEGSLNIDDPIGNYLDTDTIPNVDSAITIKNLLRHTGGLKEVWSETGVPALWSAVWNNRDSVWQPWQVLSYMPPPFPESGAHHYASTNTYLLSFIIEAVTGKDLETVFQERILNPLGMANSSLSSGKAFNMSELNGVWSGTDNRSTLPHNSYLSSRSGNSAMISTPMDMARFFRKYYNDELLPKAAMDSLRVSAMGSDTSFGTFAGIAVHQTYGYETEMWKFIMPNNDTVLTYGHGGNGLGNTLCVHWPKENITITLAENDLSSAGGYGMAQLFFEMFNEVYNDLPLMLTGVNPDQQIGNRPVSFVVFPAYPNPFNPSTTIRYEVPTSSRVRIAVYDVLGREVAVLVDEVKQTGQHSVTWNADGMASGMYYCRLEATGGDEEPFAQTRTMTLLK